MNIYELRELYREIWGYLPYINNERKKCALQQIGLGKYDENDLVAISLSPFNQILCFGYLLTYNAICVSDPRCSPANFILYYDEITDLQDSASIECIDIIASDGRIFTVHVGNDKLKLFKYFEKIMHPDLPIHNPVPRKGFFEKFLELLAYCDSDQKNNDNSQVTETVSADLEKKFQLAKKYGVPVIIL